MVEILNSAQVEVAHRYAGKQKQNFIGCKGSPRSSDISAQDPISARSYNNSTEQDPGSPGSSNISVSDPRSLGSQDPTTMLPSQDTRSLRSHEKMNDSQDFQDP